MFTCLYLWFTVYPSRNVVYRHPIVRIYHAFEHLNIKAKANQLNMEIGEFFALLTLFLKSQNLQNRAHLVAPQQFFPASTATGPPLLPFGDLKSCNIC